MALLEDFAQILSDASIATLGTDLFISILPADPVECVALFDARGRSGDYEDRVFLERPGVTAIVRAATYPACQALARQVYLTLDAIQRKRVNGNLYYSIRATRPPSQMAPPYDHNQNHRIVMTFEAQVAVP